MRLDQIVDMTVNQLIGRLLRRLLVALAVAVFAIIALYHFEASGILELEARYGAINAHLIVGGAFVLAALIGVAIWWAMGRKRRQRQIAIDFDRLAECPAARCWSKR